MDRNMNLRRTWRVLKRLVVDFFRQILEEKSWKSLISKAIIAFVVFLNAPALLMLGWMWDTFQQFITSLFGYSGKRPLTKIPGRLGMPYIGETLPFRIDSKGFMETRYFLFGEIFRSRLDFSGSLSCSRNVVVLLDSPVFHIPTSSLKLLGYHGFYGSTCHETSVQVQYLAKMMLNEPAYVEKWELIVTPIIRSFLYHLVFDIHFSFAQRVNLLACEIISTVFLGLQRSSMSLYEAMEGYLSTSQQSHHTLNTSLQYKHHLCDVISVAIQEEDRIFYLQKPTFHDLEVDSESADKSRDSFVNELLLHVDAILGEDTYQAVKIDLIFIFLIEFLYRHLVFQLRSLLFHVLVNQPSVITKGRMRYAKYLQTRQVSRFRGGEGKRLTWASVINHKIPIPLQERGAEGQEERKKERSEVLQYDQVLSPSIVVSPPPPHATTHTTTSSATRDSDHETARQGAQWQSLLSSVWTNISSFIQHSSSNLRYDDEDTSSSSDEEDVEEDEVNRQKEAEEEEQQEGVQPILDETIDSSFDTTDEQQAEAARQQQEQERPRHHRHRHRAHAQQQPPAEQYNIQPRVETTLVHLRRRETAAFTFIELIQQAVHNAKQIMIVPELPLQYSLRLCEQIAIIQRRLDENKKQFYQLNLHDILLIVHNPTHLLPAIDSSVGRYSTGVDIAMEMSLPSARASFVTATAAAAEEKNSSAAGGNLGRFADLIMNIFLHELIIGYTWTTLYDPVLDVHDLHPVTGYNSIQDEALQVKDFRCTSTISLMVSEGML